MKFLHIADLHLGKRFNEISLLDDQKYVLNQILEMVKDVDALLIAGDIYDKASPIPEAMTLFNNFLTELVSMKKKVFMISGNHDSDQRISYFGDIIESAGIYTTKQFDGKLQTIETEDEYGKLYIHLMPFLKPAHVRRFYPDEEIRTYSDAVRVVFNHSLINPQKRNILLCHQFITGSERSDSEDVTVGGLDNIDASVFELFDYVALGHIHKPQSIGRETLRYSGSIFKYSFSEADHQKGAVQLEVKNKGDVSINLLPYQFLHEVRDIEGYADAVQKMGSSDDYVRVILHDEWIDLDCRALFMRQFPNMMKFAVINSKTKEEMDIVVDEDIENKTVAELFIDFFAYQNNGQKPTDEQVKLVVDTMNELED